MMVATDLHNKREFLKLKEKELKLKEREIELRRKEKELLSVKIDPEAFYTTREAMEILDIKSQTTIIAKVDSGELKRFKQGRKIHYVGRDLLEYIHRGEA